MKCKKSCHLWLLGSAIALLALAPRQASAARCDWSVQGTLKVENARLTKVKNQFGETSPLENVLVKVSARVRVGFVWGTWNKWDEVRTRADGQFEVTNRKDCADRQLKVKVKFDDSRMEIRHEHATSSLNKVKWYDIVNDGKTDRVRTSSTVRLGALTFRPGGALKLGDFEARRHAELWNFYRLIMDHLAAKGPEFAFRDKIRTKYPHDGWLAGDILRGTEEASYCNPITKVIYIHRDKDGGNDQFDVETLAHELGHKWAYERFHGENCLTMDLIKTGDTHDLTDDPCVAFHEGFAMFFQQQIEEELLGLESDWPYDRPRLNAGVGNPTTVLNTLDRMQRLDHGWWSVLDTLTTSSLHRYDFGEPGGPLDGDEISMLYFRPTGCTETNIGFQNTLNVFHAKASAGYPEDLSREDTTIRAFLARADAILTRKMDETKREMYLALADPAADDQPRDYLCPGLIPRTVTGIVD